MSDPCTGFTGSGTDANPYLITSSADLVNLSNTEACIEGGYHFAQTTDIDFAGAIWMTGIGSGDDGITFQGVYDGTGHVITNLTILGSGKEEGDNDGVGLFDVTKDTTVRSLRLENVSVSASEWRVASLIGYADDATTVSDVDVQATVRGSYRVGGIIGEASGSGAVVIAHSSFSGSVTGTPASSNSGTSYVGGIIGEAYEVNVTIMDTVVQNSAVTLDGVNDSNDDDSVGGLIGVATPSVVINRVTVSDTTVSTNDDAFLVGGFIGDAGAGSCCGGPVTVVVEDSAFHGTVTGGGDEVGGIAGDVGTFIGRNIVVTGHVSAVRQGGYEHVGGLAGSVSVLSITDVHVSADVTAPNIDQVGGLIGDAGEGSMTDVTYTGAVTGRNRVGGLVGELEDARVENASASGSVTSNSSGDEVGGLIGAADTVTIVDSSASNTVSASDLDTIGGLVGLLEASTIERSFATGQVTGEATVGGLVGSAEGGSSIADSYATGFVSGTNYSIGGLVGYASETPMERTYATGDVRGSTAVGGLIGRIDGNASGFNALTTSYATGSVTGGDEVGGLIGRANVTSDNITTSLATGSVQGTENVGGLIGLLEQGYLQNTYATGSVSGTDAVGGLIGKIDTTTSGLQFSFSAGEVRGVTNVGGLVGINDGNVDNDSAFWDVTTSQQSSSSGGTGKETSVLRTFMTFNDAGWTIVAEAAPEEFGFVEGGDSVIWVLCDDGVATGYPQLAWQEDTRPTCGTDLATSIVTLSTPDGMPLLRNVPFDLTLALEDENGNPVVAPRNLVFQLRAEGRPVRGDLRRLGELDEDVMVMLPMSESDLLIEDLILTGAGSFDGELDMQIVAISDEPATYPDSELAIRVLDTVLTLDVDATVLPADGVATTPLLVTLQDTLGNGVPGTDIVVRTTLGTLLDANGDAISNPVTLPTDENGELRLQLQAGTELGSATITAQCPGTCTGTASVAMTSAEVSTPRDLVVIPGNQKVWLVFTKSEGAVMKYQYRLDDGPWIDVPADVVLPYLITELPNDVEVTVTVRAVDAEGNPSAPSNVNAGTPRIIGEPEAAIGLQDEGAVIEIPLQDGIGLLSMTFTFRNEGAETLTNMWIEENDLSPKGRVIALLDDDGNALPQYGDRWFWRGVNLAPGASIQGTLTMEVEE